jgi:hypothetical protein
MDFQDTYFKYFQRKGVKRIEEKEREKDKRRYIKDKSERRV